MTEHHNQPQHELNLWELCLICFRAIGRFFVGCYHFALNSLRLSLQRWYIVCPVVIIALSLALYYSREDNRIYKVGTMVHLSGINRTDVQQAYNALIQATPYYINEKQSVESLLNLSEEQVKPLRRFETFNVIDNKHDSIPDKVDFKKKHPLSDTVDVVMPDYLYLAFRTKAPQQAQVVGQAIIDYLNRDAGLQASYQANKVLLQRQSDFCHTQIDKLDSLTTTFYFEQTGKDQVRSNRWSSALVVGDRRIELIHPDILALITKAQCAERQLVLASAPVVPTSEFIVQPNAVNGRIKCCVIALILGYCLGCVVAYACKRRKDILKWLKADQ